MIFSRKSEVRRSVCTFPLRFASRHFWCENEESCGRKLRFAGPIFTGRPGSSPVDCVKTFSLRASLKNDHFAKLPQAEYLVYCSRKNAGAMRWTTEENWSSDWRCGIVVHRRIGSQATARSLVQFRLCAFLFYSHHLLVWGDSHWSKRGVWCIILAWEIIVVYNLLERM